MLTNEYNGNIGKDGNMNKIKENQVIQQQIKNKLKLGDYLQLAWGPGWVLRLYRSI